MWNRLIWISPNQAQPIHANDCPMSRSPLSYLFYLYLRPRKPTIAKKRTNAFHPRSNDHKSRRPYVPLSAPHLHKQRSAPIALPVVMIKPSKRRLSPYIGRHKLNGRSVKFRTRHRATGRKVPPEPASSTARILLHSRQISSVSADISEKQYARRLGKQLGLVRRHISNLLTTTKHTPKCL